MNATNPHWFTERPGQPVASFTAECSSVNCLFDGTGSSDPDGAALAYSWDFGDGTTSAARSPNHTCAATGRYIVTLSVADADG